MPHGEGEGRPGEPLDGGQVQEVRAQFLLPELVGGSMKMSGELVDGADVCFLGAGREPARLHVLEHALAKWRHGVPFPGGWHRPDPGAP
jgi:hypothetical protein